MTPLATHLVLTLPLVGLVLVGWAVCELMLRSCADAVERDAEPEPDDWWSSDDIAAELEEASR